MLIAKIAVEHAAFHFDRLYSYSVPQAFAGAAGPGCRVVVPFGAGNRRRQGVILELEEAEPEKPVKPLYLLLDHKASLTPELLWLVRWLKEFTFCTYYDGVRTLLPAGLGYRLGLTYRANPDCTGDRGLLDPQEEAILAYVESQGGPVRGESLCRACGLLPDSPALKSLEERGWLLSRQEARRKIGDETVVMARLSPQGAPEGMKLTPKQRLVAGLLEENEAASVKEIIYFTGVTQAVVKALEKKGVLELFENRRFRLPKAAPHRDQAPWELTPEQQRAYLGLLALYQKGEAAVSLLYGVTGSGKTRVFLRLIQDVTAQGRGVIVLVPEISLTPQTIGLFTSRFGRRVAILHSGLSMGERMDEWRRIRRGEVDIAVGTRSAVFAPFERLGLIILDEEQENAYKSEQSPRYHARDVAKARAARHGAQVILCSATPSIESYYHAQSGRYHLFTLPSRYGGGGLPQVEIVDMDQERREGNPYSVSRVLGEELAENLRRGEQSILLLNRRGYNTLVKCAACGTAVTCPNCSIGLTYHQANGRLMCHYCGYSREMAQRCQACGGEYVTYAGAGTQRLEDELRQLFPSARVLRMDADTTMAKHAYEEAFSRFGQGEYDIMVGTQMVAKGLDFPKVTLVGVLAADGSLFGDNFTSEERTFSLLTQVVGRGGRGALAGRAYIQTHFPEHEIFRLAAAQDYRGFYENELTSRRIMLYPPFCQMCAVCFSSAVERDAAQGAEQFLEMLTATARREYPQTPLRVLGVTPGTVAKVNGKYRYKIIIKCKNTAEFRKMLARVLTEFGAKGGRRGISVSADLHFDGSF